MANVGVVFGGRSVEHQVSVRSARAVARGLREAGHRVTPLGIAQDGCYPRLWELSGVPLPRLTDRLVEIAQARHRDRRRLDAAIKSWLAELEQ
jgi:hypothetical protein